MLKLKNFIKQLDRKDYSGIAEFLAFIFSGLVVIPALIFWTRDEYGYWGLIFLAPLLFLVDWLFERWHDSTK